MKILDLIDGGLMNKEDDSYIYECISLIRIIMQRVKFHTKIALEVVQLIVGLFDFNSEIFSDTSAIVSQLNRILNDVLLSRTTHSALNFMKEMKDIIEQKGICFASLRNDNKNYF